MDALAGYSGPRRARAESDFGRQSAVELHVARHHLADDADRGSAPERDSIGSPRDAEYPLIARGYHRRFTCGADEIGERPAGAPGRAAGRRFGGAAFLAGIGLLRRDREGGGARIWRCTRAALPVAVGNGFGAIAAA